MAKFVANKLPADAFELLKAGNLVAKQNRVVQVVTVGPEGWPNAGMLSYADVIANDANSIHLATWGDGECASDLRRNRKITLLVIDQDMAYYVRGEGVEVHPEGETLTDVNHSGGDSALAFFQIAVKQVLEDRVPTARVLGGVTFEGSEVEQIAHDAILKRLESI